MKTKENIKVDKNILYLLFIPAIITAKIIRYTFMKIILVDNGIGHGWISEILYGNNMFVFLKEDTYINAGGNSATIFRIINFFELKTYVEFEIYISIIFNILLFFLLIKVKQKIPKKQFLFLILSIIVLNIFDFTLAKEPIQMLYFVTIFMILNSNKLSEMFKYVLSILVIIISAFTFRKYFLLIVFFAIVIQILFQFANKKKIKIKTILVIIISLGLIYFTFLNICKIAMPEEYTELIRVRTRASEAVSDIRNLLPNSNLIFFTIDYIVILFRLMIPLELFPLGIKYWPYIVYQIVITYFVLVAVKNIKSNSKTKNTAIFLYLGFLCASATFEPDFGSWVRHEAVLFPILLIITDASKIKGQKNEVLEENISEK